MATNLENLASAEDAKLLLARARDHNNYIDRDKKGIVWETRRIEAFLLQATILEGVLVNLGLRLLGRKKHLSGLRGKRCNWYGYDNAINDLYLMGAIKTEEFNLLEQYKAKRNEYIHSLLSQNTEQTENAMFEIYNKYENIVIKMIKKLERLEKRTVKTK